MLNKRKIITTTAAIMLGTPLFAQAQLSIAREVIDMGTVMWQTPSEATFKITNEGDSPLVISDVISSCGCTQVDWTKTPIPTGEVAFIRATYDAKMLGHFRKYLTVYSNAPTTPPTLYLQGDVVSSLEKMNKAGEKHDYTYNIGSIGIDRNSLEFDEVNRGDMPEAVIYVQNNGTTGYQPELMHLPPYLTAKAIPERILGGRTGRIVVTLDSRKLNFMGLNQTDIYLARFPGDKVGDDNEISVSAILLPDFSNLSATELANAPKMRLSASEIELGRINGKQIKNADIDIMNDGESTLEISSVQLFNQAITVSLGKRTLKPGEVTQMRISLADSKYVRKAKGTPRVLMITNDPNNPRRIITANINN